MVSLFVKNCFCVCIRTPSGKNEKNKYETFHLMEDYNKYFTVKNYASRKLKKKYEQLHYHREMLKTVGANLGQKLIVRWTTHSRR